MNPTVLDQSDPKPFCKEPKIYPGTTADRRKSFNRKIDTGATGRRSSQNPTNMIHPIAKEGLDYLLETPRFDNSTMNLTKEPAIQPQLTIGSLKEFLKPTQHIDDLHFSTCEGIVEGYSIPHKDELSQLKEELQACKKELEVLRQQNRQLDYTLVQVSEKLAQEIKEKCDIEVKLCSLQDDWKSTRQSNASQSNYFETQNNSLRSQIESLMHEVSGMKDIILLERKERLNLESLCQRLQKEKEDLEHKLVRERFMKELFEEKEKKYREENLRLDCMNISLCTQLERMKSNMPAHKPRHETESRPRDLRDQ